MFIFPFAFILHGAIFQPELSRYLEECSSTLATTYSSGTPGQDASIVTVDQVGRVVVVIMIMEMTKFVRLGRVDEDEDDDDCTVETKMIIIVMTFSQYASRVECPRPRGQRHVLPKG